MLFSHAWPKYRFASTDTDVNVAGMSGFRATASKSPESARNAKILIGTSPGGSPNHAQTTPDNPTAYELGTVSPKLENRELDDQLSGRGRVALLACPQ